MTPENHGSLASRRSFLTAAGAAAAVPAAAALLGGPLADTASAQVQGCPTGTFAPIPGAALGPPLNADGYFVGNISGNLYWVTDSYYIADHIGASSLLGSDVVRIGQRENRRLLVRDNDPHRPPPDITFGDSYVLSVGGERLDLAFHGPNHTPDNIFIYAPDYQTLMVVDVIFPGWVPFKNLAISQDIPGWIGAQDVAMSYPWKTLAGGHLGRLGTRADGELQIAYMTDLLASARATIASLDPTPFFQQYGNNGWAIFQAYFNAAAVQAADPVVAKYLGQLAAVDVFTYDNATIMFESLRVDYGDLGPFGDHP